MTNSTQSLVQALGRELVPVSAGITRVLLYFGFMWVEYLWHRPSGGRGGGRCLTKCPCGDAAASPGAAGLAAASTRRCSGRMPAPSRCR
jgi:hypothetical protein